VTLLFFIFKQLCQFDRVCLHTPSSLSLTETDFSQQDVYLELYLHIVLNVLKSIIMASIKVETGQRE
jgi:hypothetical protein